MWVYIKCILKKSIIHVRLMVWHNRCKQCKAFKKQLNRELTPVAWHPTRWWVWCLQEDEKKEIEPRFADKVGR